MPCLWPASQRPMYIKTVWVGGFRHAILTKDDPYYNENRRKRRPHSSTTYSTTDNFAHQTNFNFIITSDKSQSKKEYDIEKLDLSDVEQDSEDDLVLKANQQPLCEVDSNRTKFNNLPINMRTLKSNRTARNETKENTDLSDRVLQWLDLAGKIDLLAENAERMAQPRHSWPEIQRRNQNIIKSKTTIDLRAKNTPTPKLGDSAREQPNLNIDRHEYYAPNSSANAIENYARRSRHAKSTPLPGHQTRRETKDDKTKTTVKQNIAETRQKVAAERSAVEKQYHDMVSKKLIPDVAKAKKQVHIFMPESISKKIYSNATSRTESLLSQKT